MKSIWKEIWTDIHNFYKDQCINESFLSEIKYYTKNIPTNYNFFFLCPRCQVKSTFYIYKDELYCEECIKDQNLIQNVDTLELCRFL